MAKKQLPEVGSIYSFKTTQLYDFIEGDTGRFGTFKIVGANRKYVVVGALDYVGTSAPSLEDVKNSAIQPRKAGYRGHPFEAWCVPSDWWDVSGLQQCELVGIAPLTEQETQLGKTFLTQEFGIPIAAIGTIDTRIEGNWRWEHDQVAVETESKRSKEIEEAKRKAEEELYETRLKDLTWDQLLSETPFDRWNESPPFPPKEFTQKAREVIKGVYRSFRDIGEKPKKTEARKILKDCVKWFNRADKNAGYVIETVEREDIFKVFVEIVFLTKHASLIEEIDQWREW